MMFCSSRAVIPQESHSEREYEAQPSNRKVAGRGQMDAQMILYSMSWILL